MKLNVMDKLRIWPWLLAALVCTLVVATIAPYQLGVLVWSLSKLSLGAYLGYWIDRSIFFYARPHTIPLENSNLSLVLSLAMLRRALIIAAAILALGLGV